ncbi:MAG TPA: hypothetical protein DHV17_00175 [Chitinophagaceae bacterium]|nr:hypothetical protein [Chitinophagaceae bacterium]
MSNIYDIIKEKALQQEDAVPADAWSNIVEKRRKRRPAFWIPIAAVLTGFILWGTYMMWKDDEQGKPEQEQVLSEKLKAGQVQKGDEVPLPYGTIPGNVDPSQSQSVMEVEPNSGVVQNQAKLSDTGIGLQESQMEEDRLGEAVKAQQVKSGDITETGIRKNRPGRKSSKSRTRMTVESPMQDNGLAVTDENDKSRQKNAQAIQGITVSDAAVGKEENNIDPALEEKDQVVAQTATTAGKPAIKTEQVQEKKSVEPDKKKDKVIKQTGWFAEAVIMPVLPFSDMSGNVNFYRTIQSPNNKAEFNGSMSRAKLMPALAYQVGIRKNISRRLGVGLGVQYLKMKEDVRISGLQTNTMISLGSEHPGFFDGTGMVRDTIVTYLNSNRQFRFVNQYQVISLPVSVQYWLSLKSRWSYALEGGLSLAISTRYENHINENLVSPLISSKPVSNQTTSMNLSIFTGLPVQRAINNRISAFALPMIQVSPAMQQVKGTYMDRRIHRAALGFGLSVGL